MTEKRFNLVGSYLYDGDECISHFDDPKHRDEIVELLNDFYNENEQLKQHIQTLQKQTKRLENDNIQTYTLIKESLANERTSIGQSVLKQLLGKIQ